MKTKIGELALDVTNRLGDAFADFFVEGKRGFADLARSAIKELQRIIVKAAFMKFIANPILGFLNLNAKGNVIEGGEVVPSAMGNVFAKNKIVPYAMGGIVNKPTLFPMANGMGLMGEAGPEAIMPLKRGANGKLGVQSSGGVGNIVVNVDASNSSVEGDSAQSEQFGRALAAAIQSELIQQQRPGGLLS
jgi:lambda family phage tail tape measure protein